MWAVTFGSLAISTCRLGTSSNATSRSDTRVPVRTGSSSRQRSSVRSVWIAMPQILARLRTICTRRRGPHRFAVRLGPAVPKQATGGADHENRSACPQARRGCVRRLHQPLNHDEVLVHQDIGLTTVEWMFEPRLLARRLSVSRKPASPATGTNSRTR